MRRKPNFRSGSWLLSLCVEAGPGVPISAPEPIVSTIHLSLDPLLQWADRTYLYRWRTADVTAIIGCLDDKHGCSQGDL